MEADAHAADLRGLQHARWSRLRRPVRARALPAQRLVAHTGRAEARRGSGAGNSRPNQRTRCGATIMKDHTTGLPDVVIRFRRLISLVAQVALVVIANRLAFALRFDGPVPGWAVTTFWQTLPWLVAIRALTFIPFRLYEGLWRYTSLYDLQALLGGIVTSSLVFVAYLYSG